MRIEGRSFGESVSAGPLPTPQKGEKRWTPKQARFTEALLTSNSVAEAAVKAGYPAKNARQSGHQVVKAIRVRASTVRDWRRRRRSLLAQHSLSEEVDLTRIFEQMSTSIGKSL